jgi:pSer/pThr/pTyr-binding forkhead associated (FHA) protein
MNMSFAVMVLIARIALVLALYCFLFFVVPALLRDLRRATYAPVQARGGTTPVRGQAQLVVLAAGTTPYQVGQRLTVANPTTLGRDAGCDIPVEDDFVSVQHLKLSVSGGVWLAQDLNSTNGTRVNGNRLKGTLTLKSGDLLDLGRLRLRFIVDR